MLSVRFRFANRNEITELSVGKPSTNLHQTKPRSGPKFQTSFADHLQSGIGRPIPDFREGRNWSLKFATQRFIKKYSADHRLPFEKNIIRQKSPQSNLGFQVAGFCGIGLRLFLTVHVKMRLAGFIFILPPLPSLENEIQDFTTCQHTVGPKSHVIGFHKISLY